MPSFIQATICLASLPSLTSQVVGAGVVLVSMTMVLTKVPRWIPILSQPVDEAPTHEIHHQLFGVGNGFGMSNEVMIP